MLEFFYHFSLEQNLAQIQEESLVTTKKAHQYLRLADEEKYSMFVQYILNDNFFYFNEKNLDVETAISTRDNLIGLLSQLKEGMFYKCNKFNVITVGPLKYIMVYLKYFKLIGLIEYSYYPTFSFSITPLGKLVFNLLSNRDEINKNQGKIIYLNKNRS